MAEGFCYINGGAVNDGWLQFSGVLLADGGYIRQEVERLQFDLKNHDLRAKT